VDEGGRGEKRVKLLPFLLLEDLDGAMGKP